jgi:hypothetical protein
MMEWDDATTVEVLADRFRQAFLDNGDSMMPVDRDLRRALAHSFRSLKCFIQEYARRATNDFIEALEDYGRSNELLFTEQEQPRAGGWRLPNELRKLKPSAPSPADKVSSQKPDIPGLQRGGTVNLV